MSWDLPMAIESASTLLKGWILVKGLYMLQIPCVNELNIDDMNKDYSF